MTNAGRTWKSERETYRDRETGTEVTRWTGYRGHSHHLYFTNPGWYDRGRRLLFASERENRLNLFGLELATGAITQLTGFPELAAASGESMFSASVNPCRDEAYFWYAGRLQALDLHSLKLRVLAEPPAGSKGGMTSVTADGKHVCTGFQEDLSARFGADMNRGYVGFRETFLAHPRCRVVEVPVDGAPLKVLYEAKCWIGHINTSPTQPHLLTFCYEGPWKEVGNRIWGLDRRTGKTWKIRPTASGECVGHEYWLTDGVTIGYHGWTEIAGAPPFFGFIKYDNTVKLEVPFPSKSMHFHSQTKSLVVGDGSPQEPYLRLWRLEQDAFAPPRRLCWHRSSFHIQQAHPHPCFTPDGASVLFTSDHLGYCNVHTVRVPEFESLAEHLG